MIVTYDRQNIFIVQATDDSRGVIYDCYIFIIQAKGAKALAYLSEASLTKKKSNSLPVQHILPSIIVSVAYTLVSRYKSYKTFKLDIYILAY